MDVVRGMLRANFFTTGLAMFAMFFGSGNLIFPVAVGLMAGGQNFFAIAGLFITAVLLPFATLCLMLLYDGDYHRIFQKIGVVPGKIIAFIILGLIGPFGVLPRCIAFSYSTFSIYVESLSLVTYAIIACVIVFALSVKKNGVVGIIGNLLTPVLLASLVIIIVKGLTAEHIPVVHEKTESNLVMFGRGFIDGYKTFDIFAALFFATAIMPAFRTVMSNEVSSKKSLLNLAIRSSVVGMALLFAVYAGLSFVSANLRGGLLGIPDDKLLGVISAMTLGTTAGVIANLTVSLACLTTAISLAVVSAEFLKRDVFFHKVSYFYCLVLTMIVTLFFATLGFTGIMKIIIPILMVVCPAIIALVVASGLNYFFGFRYVKASFYSVFVISLALTLMSFF